MKESQPIIIHSNDEFSDVALKINKNIKRIEDKYEDDKYFLRELTLIANEMKEGNFDNNIYFEPNSTELLDLYYVFNELLEVIQEKIKVQNIEYVQLNASLESEVKRQTIALTTQINILQKTQEELAVERDNALESQRAKDEFLANMSHEIRTPLNAIIGFVSILHKRDLDHKSLHYLDIINNSSTTLLAIINDILDFSKIQSGKFIIDPHAIEPVGEFSNVVMLFGSKVHEKSQHYLVYIDPNMPECIVIDIVRVKQIFANLLSNAIKFTPEEGTIKVRIKVIDENLELIIQDSGIGIEKKNIDKIFQAFEQADGSTTRHFGGTGLGLSISSKLATLMNGELSVKSELGKGSTFTLTLPIGLCDSKARLKHNIDEIKKLRIGIVPDNSSDHAYVNLITQYLKDYGVSEIYSQCTLGDDASQKVDLVILRDAAQFERAKSLNIPLVLLKNRPTSEFDSNPTIYALPAPYTPDMVLEALDEITEQRLRGVEQSDVDDEEEEQFSGHILVVEDYPTNMMLVSLILDDFGVTFDKALNGQEAVTIVTDKTYDFILMDENMPVLNGIEATRQIITLEKNKKIKTPIVALTASVTQEDKNRFIKAGMDDFLAKPINTDELKRVLRKYL